MVGDIVKRTFVGKWLLSNSRRPLIQFYIVVVLGLTAVAFTMDMGFYYYQQSKSDNTNRWLEFSEAVVGKMLLAVDESEWPKLLRELNPQYPIALVDSESMQLDISARTRKEPFSEVLYDQHDNPIVYWHFPEQNKAVILGPIEEFEEPPVYGWISYLFYLSIVIFVFLWFRPLLKDFDQLTSAVNQFSNNYRSALPQLKRSSYLTGLSSNIEQMAGKIRSLIDMQKDLSNVLSHELRTPLARIKFSLALLKSESQSELLHQEISGINQDVEEIEQLVNAMLNYARLDKPDFPFEPDWIEVEPWISPLVARLQRQSSEEKIAIQLNLDRDVRQIWLDESTMNLAMNNLIFNAVRFANGEVQVHIRRAQNTFVVEVDDDGPGVPQAFRHEVFKPFRQSSQNHAKQGGYGLGLAIVKRVVDIHQGKVTVSDSPLGGAKFVLSWEAKF